MKDRNMIKVTIGIPVFNAEKYIERCLISVFNQTFNDIEILLIDDCGKDNSITIARNLSKNNAKCNKIRIIHHEKNLGVANARNTILREARGKYLYFMDADDAIEKNAISIMYEKAESINAEYVMGSYQSFGNSPALNSILQYPDISLIGEDELAKYECRDCRQNIQPAIWNILFNLDFLRSTGLQFEQHGSLDDMIFQFKIQPMVKIAVLISNITYFYYKHENSLSNFQARTTIPYSEAINAMTANDIMKKSCIRFSNKPYYDCRCTKVMIHSFYCCLAIIRHRSMIDKPITNREISDLMKHPYTLWEILHFKRYQIYNLFFYFLGKMPSLLMITTMKVMSIIKKYS